MENTRLANFEIISRYLRGKRIDSAAGEPTGASTRSPISAS